MRMKLSPRHDGYVRRFNVGGKLVERLMNHTTPSASTCVNAEHRGEKNNSVRSSVAWLDSRPEGEG